MSQLKRKEFMFTFEEGGWDTVWSNSKQGAIKVALLKYRDSKDLNPMPQSFCIATENGLKTAMLNFW